MAYNDKGFFIKAEIWGKILYWNQHDGLHAGKGKRKGYSLYKTENDAKKEIKKLRTVFAKAVVFTAIPHDEIPFIKKQIVANKRKAKLLYGYRNKLTKANS